MKQKKSRLCAGETLVEVMVSALVFLLLMALMQGAVSFCSNAQKKSEQLRGRNAAICNALNASPGGGTGTGTASLDFRAVSADGSQTGQLVFTLPVQLTTRSVSDGEGEAVDFRLFAPAGGTSP